MDFSLTTEQILLEQDCTQFAKVEISPHLTKLEEDQDFRKQLYEKIAKKGWFTLSSNKLHPKGDAISYSLALKAIAKADAGIAVAMAVTNMVYEIIESYGTQEQQDKFLSGFIDGKYTPSSFALTENQAGSDVKHIKTFAIQDPNDAACFLIEGEKQFITNGDIAGIIIVIAKTETAINSQGTGAFIVERESPGLSVVKKESKLGLLTVNLVSLKFEECRIPLQNALGSPGEGLKIALSALDSGRIGIAAQALGIAEAAYEAALQFAKQREQFGHPICENQAIAFKLADMKVKLAACSLLLMKACWLKNQGRPYTLEASEAKLFCSEACNEIAYEALQIHGGYGYIKDYPVERYFRDARVTTLYEGTSEIQRIVISRHLLNK
jgi:alkylation response protein AidB-like acyl-CoA dehydrogenase